MDTTVARRFFEPWIPPKKNGITNVYLARKCVLERSVWLSILTSEGIQDIDGISIKFASQPHSIQSISDHCLHLPLNWQQFLFLYANISYMVFFSFFCMHLFPELYQSYTYGILKLLSLHLI